MPDQDEPAGFLPEAAHPRGLSLLMEDDRTAERNGTMKNNGPGKELTDQMKKELREANTKEELSALISSAGTELEDDMLDAVAGGEGCKTQCGTFHSFCLTDGSI